MPELGLNGDIFVCRCCEAICEVSCCEYAEGNHTCELCANHGNCRECTIHDPEWCECGCGNCVDCCDGPAEEDNLTCPNSANLSEAWHAVRRSQPLECLVCGLTAEKCVCTWY